MRTQSTGLVPVFGLRREIDRLFDDAFGGRGGPSWAPAVDVSEDNNEITLDIELPGIDPEQVEVSIDNGTLTVRGEKRESRKEKNDAGEGGYYHVIERNYGSFVRTFQLPQGIDENQVNAEFNNGVLEIRIPKAALPQPKRVEIRNASQQRVQGGQQGSQQTHQGQMGARTESGRSSGSSSGKSGTGTSGTGTSGTGTSGTGKGQQQREPMAATGKEQEGGSQRE